MKVRGTLAAVVILVLIVPFWLAPMPNAVPLRYAVHTIRAGDAPIQMTAEAGFGWIVQLLSWREIEPSPGDLYWEYPDALLRTAEYYGIKVVFRVDQQPSWARGGQLNAPPNDESLYPAFLSRVATRYRGRVAGYIIWNEPNLADEWGGDPPDPEAYARLLGRAADAIHRADPDALVIAAGLAPTNEHSARALDDRDFLRRQLAAPGGRSFDVLAAHAYGFGLSPDAPAGANDGLNTRRVEEQHRLLVEAGLGNREVWITELGWTVDPTSPVGAPAVTEEQRARYLVDAYRMAAKDWPWAGMLAVWSLGADEPDNDNQAGFRLAGPGYVPTLSWRALAAMPKPGRSQVAPWTAFLPGSGGKTRTWNPAAIISRAPVQVLAPDVEIHLGDQPDTGKPWRPVYGFGAVATTWRGSFYLTQPWGDWELRLQVFQPNDRGNRILINGQLLQPAYWTGRDWDFASYWSRMHFRVPGGVLRSGLNEVEIQVGQGLPAYQVSNNRWEDLQFRDIRLEPVLGFGPFSSGG